MATAMATGSAKSISAESKRLTLRFLKQRLHSMQNFTSSLGLSAISASISSTVKIALPRQASQPTTVKGTPDCMTICAASASAQMLNSATGVQLPGPRPAEPIMVIIFTFLKASGALRMAMATLDNGPSVTISRSSPSYSVTMRAMASTACSGWGLPFGSG